MKIKEIGEFGLIELICADVVADPSGLVVGIGDDAAAWRPTPGMLQLISADMLVEGIHFDLGFTTPVQLGHKALAVNLSDIAAMGGAPKQAVISIAVPQRLEAEFIVELYRGLKALAREFGVNIVGGDTVASRGDLAINVTVTGEAPPEHLVRRSTALAGELVAVTGDLGASAAGLACLQRGLRAAEFAPPLLAAHLAPRPQVEMARHLARCAASMNDISDGLASEAAEIAAASGVGICLEAARLPCAAATATAAAALGVTPLELMLYGGEDYQLVFTISEEKYRALCREKLPGMVTVIGRTTPEAGVVSLLEENGTIVKIESRGYNHFR